MSRPVPAWCLTGPEEVADGLFRMPMPVGVEGLHAVNVYVLRDEDGAIDLLDPGDAAEVRPERMDEELQAIGSALSAVRRILVTHIHPDHYTLAPPLRRRTGAPIHLGAGERRNLEELNRLRRGERRAHVDAHLERVGGTALATELRERRDRSGPEMEGPDAWIADGDRIAVGGGLLTALATPGHTQGHVVFHDAGRGLWLSGDHVLPQITPSIGLESAPVRHSLGDYLASLRLLLEHPDGVMLPAHGPVGPSVHARVRELLEHHGARLAATLDAVEGPRSTAYEVARRLRWTRHERRFDDLHPWHRYLASTETAAHLDVLVTQGQLSRHRDRAGAEHYRRASGAGLTAAEECDRVAQS